VKKYLLLLLLFVPALIMAQDKYGKRPEFTVTGSVLDSLNNEGLSFAALSFIRSKDDQLITGGICNEEGVFTIAKVPAGVYHLLIEYMGYAPKIIDKIRVIPNRRDRSDFSKQVKLDLGEFYLSRSVDELQEIELIEEKAFVVQGIDRKVFHVGQDLTSTGGTAIELMEKLPSVQVDMDGNISLRGSDQVRLYVDGKPSLLSSSDLLETTPSSMIESVELITNPSAKFSPEGMAGIINIVLKKNKKAGFNGNLALTVGYPNRNNFTALLNRRTEKLNVFGSYSIMDRNGSFKLEREKHTYFSEDTFHLYQDKWGVNNRKSHTFKAGADYTPNEHTSVSLQGKYSPSERLNMDTVHYNETTIDGVNEYDRLTESESIQGHWDVDLSGKKDWKSGLHLDINVNRSRNTKDKSDFYTETILNTIDPEFGGYPIYEQLSNNRIDEQFESKLDFSYGNEDHGKWEWGLNARTREIDQDQFSEGDSTYLDNTHLENHFIYDDAVYSAYATYARAFGLWSFQTGLRSEQANTESYLENNDSTYKADYLELYPSLHLNYKLDESSSIQASYSRRVNRPGFHSLNPFPKYSDPYNLRMGNPFLKPEFVNSVEMGYQKFGEGTTFSASVYAKDINDMQRRYISVDSNNVSTVTYQNLNGSVDIGFEFMWSKQVSKTFNFMLSSNIYHSKMDASNLTTAYDESTIGMRSGFNAGWKKNGHKIQLSGWVRPGGEVGQGKMKTMFSTDLAYSRSVFSDKGKFTLKVSDIFNTRGFGIDTRGSMFDQSFEYKRRSRYVTMSVSCRFGDQNNNRQHRKGGFRDTNGGDMDGGFF
jgi:outer membrane receptor protein involved in Fe transport